ncbi:MAG TPA: hypothetical protein VMS12_03110 [Thermoanaerobaculia bacterium]|nr:hypothetical protein [Thermoanaerobaculia bacterium]
MGSWDQQPHELIARADQALYEAKASGRNCVRTRRPETDRSQTPQRIALVPVVRAFPR